MQDTVNNINSWFKAARPIVSEQDKQVQLGVYYEEVCEFAETLVGEDEHSKSALIQLTQLLATISQGLKNGDIFFSIPEEKRVDALDAICDQIVTEIGIAYNEKMDIGPALEEVDRSNFSKFVEGKPVFHTNGKIAKGPEYFKPLLTKYI